MLVTADGKTANPPYMFDDIQYPPNIEAVYSDAELSALGLTRVVDNGPPANTIVLSAVPTKQADGTFLMVYTTTPAPVPVPQSIAVRQFWQELAMTGVIQPGDAVAAMGNTLPAAVATVVSGLKGNDQFTAQMQLAPSNPSLSRNAAIVSAIANAYKMTPEAMDEVFINGALL